MRIVFRLCHFGLVFHWRRYLCRRTTAIKHACEHLQAVSYAGVPSLRATTTHSQCVWHIHTQRSVHISHAPAMCRCKFAESIWLGLKLIRLYYLQFMFGCAANTRYELHNVNIYMHNAVCVCRNWLTARWYCRTVFGVNWTMSKLADWFFIAATDMHRARNTSKTIDRMKYNVFACAPVCMCVCIALQSS